jgi:monoamine oxidase
MDSNEKIIIIGGGLSGLTLAYKLSQQNIKTTVLEASSRIGGRIQTVKGNLGTPMELGATWFSEMHPNLNSLIEELGLKKYPQFSKGKSLFQTKSFEPPQEFFVPESENPSYRIVGGTQMLIETLSKKLPSESLRLNSKVTSITEVGNQLSIEIANKENQIADKVILCLPPELAGSLIKFRPNLPAEVSKILPEVQTWMAGSIKFALEYEEPFWRNSGYSGMLYSHSGIVAEMYDHTNFDQNKFGFTGFLNSGAISYSPEEREKLVLQHLEELLGKETLTPISYKDKIWVDEFVSGGKQLVQRPHQNNGHPLLQQSYLNKKLYFSGTETAVEFAGYMEGAVISAFNTLAKLDFQDR